VVYTIGLDVSIISIARELSALYGVVLFYKSLGHKSKESKECNFSGFCEHGNELSGSVKGEELRA
jgi:hypothetical protein